MAGPLSPKVALAMLPAALLVPMLTSPLLGLTAAPACSLPYSGQITIDASRNTSDPAANNGAITLERPETSPDLSTSEGNDAGAITLERPDTITSEAGADSRNTGPRKGTNDCVGVALTPVVQNDQDTTTLAVIAENSTSYPIRVTIRVRTTRSGRSASTAENLAPFTVRSGERRTTSLSIPRSANERYVEVGGYAGPS